MLLFEIAVDNLNEGLPEHKLAHEILIWVVVSRAVRVIDKEFVSIFAHFPLACK